MNVTLCFSPAQAILAAKAGATYISPFIGRLDDLGEVGAKLLYQIAEIYNNYPDFTTQILAASIRSPQHVVEAAQAGVDVVTLPPKVFRQLYPEQAGGGQPHRSGCHRRPAGAHQPLIFLTATTYAPDLFPVGY